VKFIEKLVTAVRTRPKTKSEDVRGLFYTEEEITKFEDAAYIEEARGMEPSSLDDSNLPMSSFMGTGGGMGGAGGGGRVEDEDDDALETFENYEDGEFDKGGFGSDDDF